MCGNEINVTTCHCVKNALLGVFLVCVRTEIGEKRLRIQSERGNKRTRKTPNKDTFHAVCLTNLNSMGKYIYRSLFFESNR